MRSGDEADVPGRFRAARFGGVASQRRTFCALAADFGCRRLWKRCRCCALGEVLYRLSRCLLHVSLAQQRSEVLGMRDVSAMA